MAVLSLPDVTATTSTKVALSSTSIFASWVQIQVPTAANSASARVGDSNISSTQGAVIPLTASAYQFFPAIGSTNQYDLSQIFILGATGDKFEVIYDTV